jgi:hypothetical protein
MSTLSVKEEGLLSDHAITTKGEQNLRKRIGSIGLGATTLAFLFLHNKNLITSVFGDSSSAMIPQLPDTLWVFLFSAFYGVYDTGVKKL